MLSATFGHFRSILAGRLAKTPFGQLFSNPGHTPHSIVGQGVQRTLSCKIALNNIFGQSKLGEAKTYYFKRFGGKNCKTMHKIIFLKKYFCLHRIFFVSPPIQIAYYRPTSPWNRKFHVMALNCIFWSHLLPNHCALLHGAATGPHPPPHGACPCPHCNASWRSQIFQTSPLLGWIPNGSLQKKIIGVVGVR